MGKKKESYQKYNGKGESLWIIISDQEIVTN